MMMWMGERKASCTGINIQWTQCVLLCDCVGYFGNEYADTDILGLLEVNNEEHCALLSAYTFNGLAPPIV